MILPMVKWKKTMKVGNMQKTFFIIKPDAVKRHLIGQVLDRIERRGFVIERMEMLMLDEERLKEHYAQLADKPFFPSISEFMMSGPAVIGICPAQVLLSHGVI